MVYVGKNTEMMMDILLLDQKQTVIIATKVRTKYVSKRTQQHKDQRKTDRSYSGPLYSTIEHSRTPEHRTF